MVKESKHFKILSLIAVYLLKNSKNQNLKMNPLLNGNGGGLTMLSEVFYNIIYSCPRMTYYTPRTICRLDKRM